MSLVVRPLKAGLKMKTEYLHTPWGMCNVLGLPGVTRYTSIT